MRGWIRDFYIEPQDGQVPSRAPYVSEGKWLMGPPQILPQGPSGDLSGSVTSGGNIYFMSVIGCHRPRLP